MKQDNFMLTREERRFMMALRRGVVMPPAHPNDGKLRDRLRAMGFVYHVRSPRGWYLTPEGAAALVRK
jgi:hypothetical protein